MDKTIRFPKPEQLAKGRNGFFETSGVSLSEVRECVQIEAWTARNGGSLSESARIVVPLTHLRELRNALDDLIDATEERDGCLGMEDLLQLSAQ